MTKARVLVTAGNTRVPIDKVRGIDNIFRGKTGNAIAEYFADQGCQVTLLASHYNEVKYRSNFNLQVYNTFDDLLDLMERHIRNISYDVIIHSAAVSDYLVDGMYQQTGNFQGADGRHLYELNELHHSSKIGSDHNELWMKLIPTIKIVDQIRKPWGFEGTLVKFKLQVGMNDEELIRVATHSMIHSEADFIVANTLESLFSKAFIINAKGGNPICVSRNDLPALLYEEVIK